MVAVSALCCTTSMASGATPGPGYALRPDHGIGPVSLRESKSRVERAVRDSTGPCGSTCLRTYDSPRGNLSVRYDAGQVSAIGSFSGQITLGGIPVRRGPRRLHRQLRGWRHSRCQGLRIYEHGGQSAVEPGTAIYFGPGRQVDVQVAASGQGGCGGQ